MSSYSATLLDHVRSPRNGGAMESPHVVGTADLGGRAPHVKMYLRVRNGLIERAMFQTYGCGVSIACCSALTEMVTGTALADCRLLTGWSLIDRLAGIPDEKQFCAQMAVDALKDAINKLEETANSCAERDSTL
jgi:NifU-like protein involved in Fe-S cluster formation